MVVFPRPRYWSALALVLLISHLLHAQSLLVEVLDVHDHPLKNIVLTAGGNSSTSSPSDVAGKTQILLPQGTKPGDPVVLILVPPPKSFMMFSPWEGRTTMPVPPNFLTVVLGARGDLAALQNNKVLVGMLNSIVAKNERIAQELEGWDWGSGKTGSASEKKQFLLEKEQAASLQSLSNAAGLDARTVDKSLRDAVKSDDPEIKQLGKAYVGYYPSFPQELNGSFADRPQP